MTNRALNIAALTLIATHMAIAVYGAIHVPIHWDEGWNLCTARIWHDFDHYGCKIGGEFTSTRLATGIVAVTLTKLGFDMFGVDYLAGRILFVAHLFVFLVAFYFLAKLLFTKRVAVLALFLPLLFPDYRVSPALLVTQAHAEVPMYLYITLGYLSTLLMLKRTSLPGSAIFCMLGALFFGLALNTKHQAEPFLLLALAFVPVALVYMRQYRLAAFSLIMLIGAYYLMNFPLSSLAPRQVSGPLGDGSGTEGMAELLGINTDLRIRKLVIVYVIQSYWFHLLGIALFPLALLRNNSSRIKDLLVDGQAERVVRLSLYIVVLCWTGWFLLLSIHFPRYFSPPATFGVLFSALGLVWLWSWSTGSKGFRAFVSSSSNLPNKALFCTASTVLIVQFAFSMKYVHWYINQDVEYNTELVKLADYFNAQQEILVETYDSQLFHLLDVPFHYPPDQMNVVGIAIDLGRSSDTWNKWRYDYEDKEPDYVVVGEWSDQVFKLYRDIGANNNYSRYMENQQFSVYRRTPGQISD
jgi:hypothetical protein